MSSDPNNESDAATWLWIGGIALLFFFPILLIPVGLFFLFKWWIEAEKTKHAEATTPKHASGRKPRSEPATPTNFQNAVTEAVKWSARTQSQFKNSISERGWVTVDLATKRDAKRAERAVALLSAPENVKMKSTLSVSHSKSVKTFLESADRLRERVNKRVLEKNSREHKEFFDTVQSNPLTSEQIESVLTFDNRNLVIASAGSGKTATIVSKAAYAVSRGYFKSSEILLLAFNRDAADQLKARIADCTGRVGLGGSEAKDIAAKTFHAFGLEIIGAVTGEKPSPPAWMDQGKELEFLLEIVDGLKDSNQEFRVKWDLFRLVLPRDLPELSEQAAEPESWDPESGTAGFWTFKDEIVKSRGEQTIANWLFYQGVEYQYERPYKIRTADAKHQQYTPDFYLPQADVWLEHWALDENGEIPEEFVGYEESMRWKRQLHRQYGTVLLETSYGQLWNGEAFSYLEKRLRELRVPLDPNPDRKAPGKAPISNRRILKTFRTFLSHCKNGELSYYELNRRAGGSRGGKFVYRKQVFLWLFRQVWEEWDRRIKGGGHVDFDDMILDAARHVGRGEYNSPYRLILVDEFQDSSRSRIKLLKGLCALDDLCLVAVGDDWQSINRFSGADLSGMTRFDDEFGRSISLPLQKTFRCSQLICDISSDFIKKNPSQIDKNPVAFFERSDSFIRVRSLSSAEEQEQAVAEIASFLVSGESGRFPRGDVLILGRYNADRKVARKALRENHGRCSFRTIHRAKGLESDYVLLINCISGSLGFPSEIEDDPILQLAMSDEDEFEYAEERRLFYVALTRARQGVVVLTLDGKESGFVAELVQQSGVPIARPEGSSSTDKVCPRCSAAFLQIKPSKNGPFLSCSRFPKCKFSESIPAEG